MHIYVLPLQYHQLPKQIVTPYKPSDDHDQSTSLTRASSDVSDRAPLLKKVGYLTFLKKSS